MIGFTEKDGTRFKQQMGDIMINRCLDRKSIRKLSVVLCACASYGAMVERAAAQTAAAPQQTTPATLDEVVVTAEKRGSAQAVQKVPESIQVISSKSLDQQHITNFNDYVALVPGLSAVNQGPGQTQTIIRGVSSGRQSYAEPQIRQNTGLYIDDASVSASVFNPDLDLFDVDHIEVLKGPQGTLYGDGSESGTIRILTKQPEFNRWDGLIETGIDGVDGGGTGGDIRAMINIPVIQDRLAVRAAVYDNFDPGWIDNVYLSKKDSNSTLKQGGSIIARLQATNDLEVKFTARYQYMDAQGRPAEFAQGDPAIVTGSPGYTGIPNLIMPGEKASQFAITGPNQTVAFGEDPFVDHFLILDGVVNWNLGSYKLTSSSTYIDRSFENTLDDTYRARDHLAYSYELAEGSFGGPQYGTNVVDANLPNVIGLYYNKTKLNDFQQEVRLVSPDYGPFGFIVGGYYEHGTTNLDQVLPIAGLDQVGAITGYWGSSPSYGTTGSNILFEGLESVHSDQEAIFTEMTYKITSKLKATVGGRGYWFDQTASFDYSGLAGAAGPGEPLIKSGSTNAKGFNPKFVLSYQATNDKLFYASASEGFRLGGIQEPVPVAGPFSCAADFAALGLKGEPNAFKSDSLWDYEGGVKTSWLDRALQVNATVYHIQYKNLITPTQLACGYLFYSNAGIVDSNGAELEVSAKVLPHLTLGLNGSYDDAYLTNNDPGIDAFKGDNVPSVPKWQFSATASSSFALTSKAQAFIRGDIDYASSSLNNWDRSGLSTPDNVAGLTGYAIPTRVIPSYVTGNISFGVDQDRYEFMLYIHNLWNERIVTAINTDRLVPTTYSVAQPLTVGASIRVKLGSN